MEPPGYKIGVLYQGDYRNEEAGVWRWADSQLLIYDTRNDEMIQSLLHLPPLILGFSFSPDGEAFVLATQDGDLSLWETASAVSLRTATPYDVNTEPQISPDGRRVAYSYHSSARVFSPSGELQQVITPTHGTLDLEVRFVDANRLALFYLSISGDYVEIWDLVRGEIAYIAPYVLGPCDFTADGHTMICHQPSTRFIDTRSGEKLMDVGEAAYGIGRYAFSPDDRYIAYCGIDWPSIYLFKRSTGKYLGMLTADAPTVCGNLAFSPDSARLASAAGFAWNLSSLRLAFTFEAHPESAPWTPLAYGPQGDIFFVGGDVFDAATGNKLAHIPVGGQALYFSADGTLLIAISNREWSIWTTH
jgi:WD40 repeat protein